MKAVKLAALLLAFVAFADEGDINEYTHKMVIKIYVPEEFELIDLQQVDISTKPKEPLFDSSAELARNDIYLQYEDTDKDFVLFAGYNENLHLEFENLSISGDEFLKNIFEKFINEANSDKSVQLLNTQNNALYETAANFKKLDKNEHEKQFFISPLLDLETSFDRMYVKKPEFILLVVFDECLFKDEKSWFFGTQEMAYINMRYKILRLKGNKTVQHKRFRFNFKVPPIKNGREKYTFVANKTGEKLKEYFAKVVQDLEN